MPVITNIRAYGDTVISEIVDSIGPTDRTFTFADANIRDTLVINNIGDKDIIVSVGTQSNVTVPAYKSQIFSESFTSFTLRSASGHASVRIVASYQDEDEEDEKRLAIQLAQKMTQGDLVLNVKDYPKLSGETDDTLRIQRAIDDAFNNGINRVYLPTGTFNISQLKLRRGITLTGSGIYSTILSGNSATDMIVLYDETSAYCRVENLFVQGNNIANRGIYAYKAVYESTYLDNSFSVENVLVKKCNVAGVQLGQAGTASIMECRLTNVTVNQCNGIGIYLTSKCTDSYFVNCTGATCLQGGIKVEGFNLKFINCKTYFNGTVASPYSGFIVNSCSVNVFTNCEAQDNYKHGFEVVNSQNIGFDNLLCDRNGNGGIDGSGNFIAPVTPLYSGIYLENSRRINVDGVFTDSNYLTLQKHTQLSAVSLKSTSNVNINASADTHPYYVYDADNTNHFVDELTNGIGYVNIIPSLTFTSPTTVNGITYTKINESTILVNGTATADAKLTLFGAWGSTANVINVPDYSRLKVGLTLRNDNTGTVYLTVVKNSTTVIISTNQDYYENVKVSYPINQLELKVPNGTTVSNVLIQPKLMIKPMTLKGQYDS